MNINEGGIRIGDRRVLTAAEILEEAGAIAVENMLYSDGITTALQVYGEPVVRGDQGAHARAAHHLRDRKLARGIVGRHDISRAVVPSGRRSDQRGPDRCRTPAQIEEAKVGKIAALTEKRTPENCVSAAGKRSSALDT